MSFRTVREGGLPAGRPERITPFHRVEGHRVDVPRIVAWAGIWNLVAGGAGIVILSWYIVGRYGLFADRMEKLDPLD